MASEHELDMVEVAPNARPPGREAHGLRTVSLRAEEEGEGGQKNSQSMDLKEVQLRPRTDDHDFDVKLKRARRFLDEGNAVKVVVRFRGRELRRPEVGVEAMDRMLEAVEDIGKVEHRSRAIEGRRLVARLEPR